MMWTRPRTVGHIIAAVAATLLYVFIKPIVTPEIVILYVLATGLTVDWIAGKGG